MRELVRCREGLMIDTSQLRLRRLFASDGRSLAVALDSGVYGEPNFWAGLEKMPGLIRELVSAEPDAIQLAPGQVRHLARVTGVRLPALILRGDFTNTYATPTPAHPFWGYIEGLVETAVRADAAAVIVGLQSAADDPDVVRQCLRNISALRAACEQVAMPLIVDVEPLTRTPEGYRYDPDPSRLGVLVRQAVELGVDAVKVHPTDRIDDFGSVVEAACGAPVIALGGRQAELEPLAERTARLILAGACGAGYGRNITRQSDPAAATRRLMTAIHNAEEEVTG